MIEYEVPFWEKGELVVGIDEAGRGPMAGPLVVCGVVLPKYYQHPIINDSKALSEKKRLQCFADIVKDALIIETEIVEVTIIDQINIYQATKQAMETIVEKLSIASLIDAIKITTNHTSIPIIKGDQKSISIAAASIIAKVTRDTIMQHAHQQYPVYGFDKHKGYPTKAHQIAIKQHGLSPLHRKTFTFKNDV